jgi:hypothetical protein
MTTVTMLPAAFAASHAVAQQLTHQPHRLAHLASAAVASGRAIGGFVSGVIRAPILPVEALLEASVLVSMLDSHADRDQVRSALRQPSDGFLWQSRE